MVEHWIVVPVAVGSSPTQHPKIIGEIMISERTQLRLKNLGFSEVNSKCYDSKYGSIELVEDTAGDYWEYVPLNSNKSIKAKWLFDVVDRI